MYQKDVSFTQHHISQAAVMCLTYDELVQWFCW